MSNVPLLETSHALQNIEFGNEELPAWMEDHLLKVIRKREGDEARIDLNRTAGPALLWGFASLIGLTYFMTALPVIGFYIARCHSDENYDGFAKYPEIILWLIFFLPLAAIVLAAQWKSSTFLLVPMLQEIQSRNSSSAARARLLTFRLWYLAMCAFTMFNLLDQMTNALFAAKIYATKQCNGYNKIQEFWEVALQKSVPSIMRGVLFLDYLDFADITVVIYIIQLFVQPIYALIFSWPLNIKAINFKVQLDSNVEPPKFKTISDENENEKDLTDFKSAVMVLAEVNRMEALVSFDLDYRESMIERLMEEADQCEEPQHKLKIIEEALEVGLAILARSAARFALKGLVQNCLQVNLQVSMQAISKASMPDHFDFFNGVNLGVTMLAVFLDIPDMIQVFGFVHWLQNEVATHVDEAAEHFEEVQARIDTMKWRFTRIKIYAVLYVLMAGYALTKLYMALVVCESGEWNMSDVSWSSNGCVAFELGDIQTHAWQCNVSEYQCRYVS